MVLSKKTTLGHHDQNTKVMIKKIKVIIIKYIAFNMVKRIKLIMFMNIKLMMIKKFKVIKRMKMMIQVKAGTETFLWQLEGSAVVTYGNGEQVVLHGSSS